MNNQRFGRRWHVELPHFTDVNQNSRDPNSPDHSMNCGPSATAAMVRYATGIHLDPEQLRIAAGDTFGEGTGTGPEIDQYAYRRGGPCPAEVDVLSPGNPVALRFHIYWALTRGFPVKMLQNYNPGGELHYRVIHGSKAANGTRLYLMDDPWVGEDVVQTVATMLELYAGQIIIPHRHRPHWNR